MKIRFLGSGDGVECKIKKRLSKEYRRPASILIDDWLLIDPSDEAIAFADEFGLGSLYSGVTDIIFTLKSAPLFSKKTLDTLTRRQRINIFAPEELCQGFSFSGNFSLYSYRRFTSFKARETEILPLTANCEGEALFSLAIFSDRALLYAPRGGWISGDGFALIKGLRFDAAVIDCAMGDGELCFGHIYHNGVESAAMIKKMLSSAGVLGEKSRFILTSLPTNKKRSNMHEELAEAAAEHGMTAAYDGYFVSV